MVGENLDDQFVHAVVPGLNQQALREISASNADGIEALQQMQNFLRILLMDLRLGGQAWHHFIAGDPLHYQVALFVQLEAAGVAKSVQSVAL